jgi:hypothetical protein
MFYNQRGNRANPRCRRRFEVPRCEPTFVSLSAALVSLRYAGCCVITGVIKSIRLCSEESGRSNVCKAHGLTPWATVIFSTPGVISCEGPQPRTRCRCEFAHHRMTRCKMSHESKTSGLENKEGRSSRNGSQSETWNGAFKGKGQ